MQDSKKTNIELIEHHSSYMLQRKTSESTPGRLERVLEISRDLVSTVDLPLLLHRIAEIAVELTDATVAGILLFDERKNELRFKVASQFIDRVVDIPVPIDGSIAGEAFSSGAPVIVSDLPGDPRHYPLVGQTIQYEAQSLLAVPLQFRDRKIGVLEVEDKRDEETFSQEDVAMLTALAAQATVAIENARLVTTLHETQDGLERQVAARTADLTATVGQLENEIGERMAAEAALRRSEELYRTVVENSQAGILIIDQDRRFIYVNDELCRILGYSAGELIGHEFTMILAEESRDLVLDRYRRRQRGEDAPSRYEIVGLRKDGERRILELTASVVSDSAIGVASVGQVLDVTDQKEVDRLRVLSEIGAAVVSSLELDAILKRVVRSILQAIGSDQGGVFLVDPDTDDLVLSVAQGEGIEDLVGLRLQPGQGVAGWVVEQRQAVLVNDAYGDRRFCSAIDKMAGKTHSLLCAPLLHRDRVIGVIEIVNKHWDLFTGEDLALVEATSSIVANAIQNAHLYETVQGQVEELRVLNNIGLALSATLKPVAVARVAVSLTQKFFKARVVALLRIDNANRDIVSLYGMIDGKFQEISTSLPFKHSAIRSVVEHKEPILITDAQSDPRWSEEVDENIQQHLDEALRAVMVVPLTTPNAIIGMLLVADTHPGIYKNQDVSTLLSIGSTLSVAMQNATLYEAESRAREAMHGLTTRLAEVEEEERRRLAGELHDRVGQDLTALDISLKIVQRKLPTAVSAAEFLDELTGRLEDATTLVKQTSRRVRNVMDDLRPPALEEYGLLAALRWYATDFSRRTGMSLAVHGPEPEPRLAPLVETVLFRITQEALTNVIRHAETSRAEVRVGVLDGVLRLTVADEGVGMDLRSVREMGDRQRWGLQTMIERAESIGGLFWIESELNQGTRIVVEVPFGGSL